jgi:hypothetical protein
LKWSIPSGAFSKLRWITVLKVTTPLPGHSRFFKKEAGVVYKMPGLLGGWRQGEEQACKLADSGLRKGVKLIAEAKQYDAKACECLKDIVSRMKK